METFPQLEEVFGFTHEEILLNREGIYSERQQEAIQKRYRNSNIIILLTTVIYNTWAVISIIGLKNEWGKVATPFIIVIIITILYFWGGYPAPLFRSFFQYERTWKSGNIYVVKGVHSADFAEHEVGRGKSYTLDVENGIVNLNEKQFSALDKSESYAIYYLPYDGKSIHLLTVDIDSGE